MAARPDGTIHSSTPGGRRRTWAGVGLIVAAAVVAVVTWWDPAPAPAAWVSRESVAAGAELDPAGFELMPVSVPDAGLLWPADVAPSGVAGHALQPGEPLFTAAAQAPDEGARVTVPVPTELLPVGLVAGDVVDVWQGGSVPALTEASVTAVVDDQTGAGRVELAVSDADTATAVRLASSERLVLVRR